MEFYVLKISSQSCINGYIYNQLQQQLTSN